MSLCAGPCGPRRRYITSPRAASRAQESHTGRRVMQAEQTGRRRRRRGGQRSTSAWTRLELRPFRSHVHDLCLICSATRFAARPRSPRRLRSVDARTHSLGAASSNHRRLAREHVSRAASVAPQLTLLLVDRLMVTSLFRLTCLGRRQLRRHRRDVKAHASHGELPRRSSPHGVDLLMTILAGAWPS